jgi:LysR family transcriptional regulator, transcriptional activator of nhaA
MNTSFDKTELIALARFNYHHLYYFWAVAKNGNLTQTAEQLLVSQSALSSQIRQLESNLKLSLFSREHKKLLLTQSGQLVLDYAENIFGLGRELLASVGGQASGVQLVRIGSEATLSRNFQENLLRPLLNDSGYRLVLESASLDELLQRLALHKIDMVLANRAVSGNAERPWQSRRIARQAVVLVAPKKLKQLHLKKFPHDLHQQPINLPAMGSTIRARFDAWCDEHAVQPVIRAEVQDMAMLRLLARDSACLSLVPQVVVQDELGNGLLTELYRLPQIEEQFYAITLPRALRPSWIARLLKDIAEPARR